MAKTYYEILGVAENATAAEIEAAFKARAREVHPDRVEPGSPYLQRVAAEAFKDLAEAKSVLLDPVKRQNYDIELTRRHRPEHAHRAPAGARPAQSTPSPSQPMPPAAEEAHRTRPRFSWQSNGRLGSAVFVALGLGAVFVLGGLIWSGRTPPLWVVISVIALALVCWRQGMRPSANTTVPSGDAFFVLFAITFAAISLAYWFRPVPSDSGSSSSETGTQASTGRVVPRVDNTPAVAPRRTTTQRVTVEDPTIAGMNGSGGVTRIWKSRRDGQNYRTRLSGDALYLEAVKTQTKNISGIVRCEFRRAASAGPEWTGVCWERKPRDENSYERSATATLSGKQIEGRTSDIPEFAMTAVDSVQIGTAASELGGAPASQETGAPQSAQTELSGLTDAERQSVESACSYSKLMQGPAEYDGCLEKQIAALRALPKPPDLSNLSSAERESIESACSSAKLMQGPAAYNQCLSQQVGLLKKQRR